jgi:predicted aspartyl protease
MPAQFHAFTIKYQGRVNRLITLVEVLAPFDPTKGETAGKAISIKALWDTGATGSVITAATASALGLTSVGQVTMDHAGGSSQSNRYLVNIMLPNRVNVIGALVSECGSIAGDVGGIIGMDIIARGDFSVTNVNGLTCMSFRLPSIETIDYVVEANKLTYAGVGRNDPCPCGAKDENGKPIKFKRCHGK